MSVSSSDIPVGERVAGAVAALADAVGDLDAATLAGVDAERLMKEFTQAERVAQAGKALCAARAAACGAWRAAGERSPAGWLARRTGTSVGGATATLATAQRMAEGPSEVRHAWQSGKLSAEAAGEIAATTEVAPHAGASLLQTAGRDTMAGLRHACRNARSAAADEADEQRRYQAIHRARSLHTWIDGDGAGRVDARLTPDALARLRACLQPFEHEMFETARRAGHRERHDAHAADALIAMAEAANSDGDGDGRRPPAQVIVRVDHTALARGHTIDDETCELDGAGPIPVTTARAIANDAFLAAVVTNGTDIRSVAHLGRTVTAAQRTALVARDTECVVPGCHARHHLEIDHITGWALTRTTRLDDLARLCPHHHRLKTYDGWTLTGPPGQWAWHPPPGAAHPGAPPGTLFSRD